VYRYEPGLVSRLSEVAKPSSSIARVVRFAESRGLPCLSPLPDLAAVRLKSADLMAAANASGLGGLSCGYGFRQQRAGARSTSSSAAEAAVEYARRIGPGAFVG